MENIQGKTIIITGASSGIGKATATKLAENGAQLVLAARNETKLQELTNELAKKFKIKAIYKVTDVTQESDIKDLVNFTITNFHKIDVLFNNAGLMPVSLLRDGKSNEWERMIDVNLKGALYGIKYVLPIMEKQHNGHIITTDSVAGHFVGAGSAVYSGTKFAMRTIMEGLRVEEVGNGIKSTLISPGHSQTGLASTISDKKLKADVLKSEQETGLKAEDVANAVIYAINTPDNVGINEVILRSTNQRDY
ncbi:SDR family oxidoreductase [Companilactobacillus bobalius]|uniref:Glucose 1-dehydrogenase n=2 Tax=Companilactobacillus bobalius TaxID=2801451 RepID=A0A202F860_9LACO|nr:SDR family oxidoreductase [Companilactobacillus bobalius]GEO58388.1 oxidoreductase [Companilactobacillus paralimentarius]KAE9557658.1 oxidoreductase [Companilactobacillus bobalius]KAE9563804.1 oxidoreductase [Companilactobacillus bobalius]KRK83550.1 oxidoreductase [Companilactobacillus bobalius DSM 19674]OVE96633.1 Glucose 1-dehydrogenase [Companilactobacillus bobalius]